MSSLILLMFASPCEAHDIAIGTDAALPIRLADPLTEKNRSIFGDGWVTAFLHTKDESLIQLFQDERLTNTGGVVFERFDRSNISPSGDYAVLPLVRQGILDMPGENSKVQGREYCPVVELHTGCVISMPTGEVCGGKWSAMHDRWFDGSVDKTPEMLNRTTIGAQHLWIKFSDQIVTIKMHDLMFENLGVENILICDPVTDKNKSYYVDIARQLNNEFYTGEAKYIEGKLGVSGVRSLKWRVQIERAPLYGDRSEQSKSKMYLVKNDVVHEIQSTPDGWMKIKYVSRNGVALIKWMKAADLENL
ncbi:hypothetical protein [Paraburkholderia sp. ZP32-5]|uniref:hypothetical protein n=1 Tax=Paraburkholderia sp. ZP32-5 TaxID=2883245 RepID=UPI001F2C6D91|nr:hypothetical protein [Paraburkholderia sp. ZP32-5]